jgi:hypothetical protein
VGIAGARYLDDPAVTSASGRLPPISASASSHVKLRVGLLRRPANSIIYSKASTLKLSYDKAGEGLADIRQREGPDGGLETASPRSPGMNCKSINHETHEKKSKARKS